MTSSIVGVSVVRPASSARPRKRSGRADLRRARPAPARPDPSTVTPASACPAVPIGVRRAATITGRPVIRTTVAAGRRADRPAAASITAVLAGLPPAVRGIGAGTRVAAGRRPSVSTGRTVEATRPARRIRRPQRRSRRAAGGGADHHDCRPRPGASPGLASTSSARTVSPPVVIAECAATWRSAARRRPARRGRRRSRSHVRPVASGRVRRGSRIARYGERAHNSPSAQFDLDPGERGQAGRRSPRGDERQFGRAVVLDDGDARRGAADAATRLGSRAPATTTSAGTVAVRARSGRASTAPRGRRSPGLDAVGDGSAGPERVECSEQLHAAVQRTGERRRCRRR